MREKVWPHKTTLQFFSLCTDTVEKAVENHEFLDILLHVTKLTHECIVTMNEWKIIMMLLILNVRQITV